MANEQQTNVGALAGALDYSKFPLTGTTDEQLQNIQEAQQQALDALQKRYEQPNWFKVAAGFAKPQLGGFAASLGSASDALGDWVEQQRAQQLPISQMRAQLAQTNALMQKNKDTTDEINDWQTHHPGQNPDNATLARWSRMAPQSPAVTSMLEQQKLGVEQQGQALQVLKSQYDSGAITKEQYQTGLAQLQRGTNWSGNPAPASVPVRQASTMGSGEFLSKNHDLEGIPAGQTASNSTATGPGGLLEGTVKGLKDKYNLPEGYGTDPNVTDQYERTLLNENGQALSKNGLPASALNHRVMWWLGAPDGTKVLKANPDAKLGDLLSEDVLSKNNLDADSSVRDFTNKVGTSLTGHNINPNHIISDQPAAQTGSSFESAGVPGTAASELAAKNLDAINKAHQASIDSIIANDPLHTVERKTSYSRAATLLADKNVQSAMGQLYKGGANIGTGLLNALQEGIHLALDTPLTGGTLTAAVQAPVDTFLTSANVDEKTRAKLKELSRIIMNDSIDDLRQGSQALGGGHMNQNEFASMMSRVGTVGEPYKNMSQYVALRATKNDLNEKLYKMWNDYSSQPDFARKPYSNFWNQKDVQKVMSDYAQNRAKAYGAAD
jgi:hypothetical protein